DSTDESIGCGAEWSIQRRIALLADRPTVAPQSDHAERVNVSGRRVIEPDGREGNMVVQADADRRLQAVVDFLNDWRFCPVATSPKPSRQCMEDAAAQLLASLPQSDHGPERCPMKRVSDGRQCVRPVGHPGDCAATWGSTTADFGHGRTAQERLEALAAEKGRSMAQVIEDAERIEREFGREKVVVVCEKCGHAQERPTSDHGPGEASDAIRLIAAERERQVDEEGWTPEHDDTHSLGELRLAAKAYAGDPGSGSVAPMYWPWEDAAWKPSDEPVRNLVKSGALIVAEIERLQRLGAQEERSDA
ncbi:MAG: hypothetical protein ACM3OA_06910, partial [Acidobacteriota bacterium]